MSEPTNKQLSRRDALKLLGAAAGASVLANLPSRWSTPQSVAGVLPAHANSSPCETGKLSLEVFSYDGPGGTGTVDILVPPGAGSCVNDGSGLDPWKICTFDFCVGQKVTLKAGENFANWSPPSGPLVYDDQLEVVIAAGDNYYVAYFSD